jgi:hypothetical protein
VEGLICLLDDGRAMVLLLHGSTVGPMEHVFVGWVGWLFMVL